MQGEPLEMPSGTAMNTLWSGGQELMRKRVTKLSMHSSHFSYDSGSWGSNSGAFFNQTMQ
ncbi:polyprotein [Frankliniella fusca]|uniref:Polyprotein n=1 Tax=Frankliniella fusca TaxID=407009 RepID=A0AAE1HWX6_9NEOP|nr:polyprotein [Frankliniella fusca]